MKKLLLAALISVQLTACVDGWSTTSQEVGAPNAVTTWHANAQALVAGFTGRGNAAQAYTSSLIQVAVYDAAVAIQGGYDPYVASIAAPAGADLNAAIATAAFRVGITRVTVSPGRATFQTQYTSYLAAIPDSQAKTDGIAVGEAAAQAVLAARAGDNFYNTNVYANPPADVGVWQAVSVANQYATAGANDYQMSFVVPWSAASLDAYRAPPPSNLQAAVYSKTVAEVQADGRLVSASRTAEMTNRAQFWTESGFTLWQRNTRAIVTAANLDELEAARALAALGVAGGDGMLACFENKYHYMYWRPFQAIQRADEDGNKKTAPEAGWAPLVRANHPEYPSGHACFGTAMVTALGDVFGDFSVTLTSTGNQVVGWPVVPTTSYSSLHDIIDDTANARVWSGLHYRTTMDKTEHWMKDTTNQAVCGHFGITCD